VPIIGITDLYGQRPSGLTGAGALDTRRGLPGYGPPDNAYGQAGHGRWGDEAGPAYAAPGWNAALRREANLDVYTADFTLTDDTDTGPLGPGPTGGQLDQTPFPKTELAGGYAGRGQSDGGYHPEVDHPAAAPAGGLSSHAGPYPRTWLQAGRTRPETGTELDDQWTEQEARRAVHEVDYGAGQTGWTTWQNLDQPARRDLYFTSQGSSKLAPDLPGQLRYSGGGGRQGTGARQHGDSSDQVQGGGRPNGYGYGDAHGQNYRQQADPVPFNYQWLDASERPFTPKGQATNAALAQTFTGADNPYGAFGDQTDYSGDTYQPAMVEGPATAYAAPPDPVMSPGYADAGDDVFAWG
jgi:hypothetical protein